MEGENEGGDAGEGITVVLKGLPPRLHHKLKILQRLYHNSKSQRIRVISSTWKGVTK